MIGVFIGIAVAIITIIGVRKIDKNAHCFNIITGAVCGIVVFFLYAIISINFNNCVEYVTEEKMIDSVDIVALKDTSSLEGKMYLGAGRIEDEEYYGYYKDTEYGRTPGKLEIYNTVRPVYINYISEDETPHIDQYALVGYPVLKEEPNIWVSLPVYFTYKDNVIGDVLGEESVLKPLLSTENYDHFRYEIYIPEGSIQENYVVDME